MGSFFSLDLILGFVIGAFLTWLIAWAVDSRLRRRDALEHEEELSALNQSLDTALVSKSAAQHELSAMQDAHTEVLNRNQSLDHLAQQLQTKQASLEQEMTDSRTQLRKMASIQQANDTLRNKLTSAENRVRELTTENTALSVDTQSVTTLQAELDQNRSRIEQLEADKLTLRDKLAHTETELATMGAKYSTNMEDMGDVDALRAQHAQAQQELERLRAAKTTTTAESERLLAMRNQIEELENRLETAEEALLHEQNRVVAADVKLQTMADKLTDERLRAQAVEQELDSIRSGSETINIARMRAEMAAQQHEIGELKEKLSSGNVSQPVAFRQNEDDATVLHLAEPTNSTPAPVRGKTPTWIGRATSQRQAAQQPKPEPTNTQNGMRGSQKRDRLQNIHGIGNVFAARLQQAGVDSFQALSQLSPERAAEIVRAKPWQAVDATAWIDQARQFAAAGDQTA